ALASRLLLQRLGELRDAQIRRVELLRASLVQAQTLLIQLHGLIEVELRVLELLGDRLESLQRLFDGRLGFRHPSRPLPRSRSRDRRASSAERGRPLAAG